MQVVEKTKDKTKWAKQSALESRTKETQINIKQKKGHKDKSRTK